MSTVPPTARERPAELVAGFLAVLAMAGGAIALVVRPVPLGVASIVIGFVAVALADRNQRLAAAGVTLASVGFLGGMIVSVLASRPLW
ncbi:MAG TPA: hypothetical protein VG144_12470 [Gaiellaceae bacterium]|nr:hypothetical protein [Gaiellaceae bacterium]